MGDVAELQKHCREVIEKRTLNEDIRIEFDYVMRQSGELPPGGGAAPFRFQGTRDGYAYSYNESIKLVVVQGGTEVAMTVSGAQFRALFDLAAKLGIAPGAPEGLGMVRERGR